MRKQHLGSWLSRYDPIHRGWTRFGIANGLCTTSGFFFPRVGGGYNLYRSADGIPDPDAELVGAAGAGASTIQTFSWVTHQPGKAYRYRLVPVGGGGVENWGDETVALFRMNEAGGWIGRLPNAPTDLQMVQLDWGRFAVRWTYLPAGEEIEPVGFRLYTTWDGTVDYGSISGLVTYTAGRIHYEFVTQTNPDGARVGWAVRAYSLNGYEEQNTNQVFALAHSKPPPINPAVMVTVV